MGEQLWGPREMLDSSNQIWQVKGELQPAGIWTISWAKVVLKLTPGVSVRLNTRVLLKQKKSNVFEDMSGRESALPVWESLAYERARSLDSCPCVFKVTLHLQVPFLTSELLSPLSSKAC